MDLELDFLAPFLVKHGGLETMTRKVALQVREWWLKSARVNISICLGERRVLGEHKGKHGREGA